VAESEVLLTIAEADAVFFNAQVPQRDLARIAPGQTATIDMPAAGGREVRAVVHSALPSASSRNLSAPVRLDVLDPRPALALGLFGTAHIVVERRDGALVVPAAAVLTDDVSGTRRMAVVDSTSAAHWVRVETGVRDGGLVELLSPSLPPGTLVITDGQVGLPDSAKVVITP
jgi:multidrug efflux pump subunit AcrA (membrane-fusion protein)